MFVTTLGVGLTQELGLASPTFLGAGVDGDPLGFGPFAHLANLLTETPLDQLQPMIVKQIASGTSFEQLISAGALANARAFGGEDYNGYHAFMALMPAYQISQSMLSSKNPAAAMPVLKVLYRNTKFMQNSGADHNPVLVAHPSGRVAPNANAQAIVASVRKQNLAVAEATFDAAVREDPKASFEQLIPVVCQEVDVHRVVLAWRGWDLLRLTGEAHARTLMRQSIRQCVGREDGVKGQPIRHELPEVLEQSGVLKAPLGHREVDDAWINKCALELCDMSRKEGAALVAEALREGLSPEAIGEALSLASTYLMLRQPGRKSPAAGRPKGSVHGAGTGVHSSDTAAAWRGMARFGSEKQCKMALVAGAYHVAGQSRSVMAKPFNYDEIEVESNGGTNLLRRLTESLQFQDQAEAAAVASHYAKLTHDLAPLLAILLDASVAAEGALHAEKYYRTQVEAIEGDRASFRPLHCAALARVCASQAGAVASGRSQALELLG